MTPAQYEFKEFKTSGLTNEAQQSYEFKSSEIAIPSSTYEFKTEAIGAPVTSSYEFKTETMGTPVTSNFEYKTETIGAPVTSNYEFKTETIGAPITSAYEFTSGAVGGQSASYDIQKSSGYEFQSFAAAPVETYNMTGFKYDNENI